MRESVTQNERCRSEPTRKQLLLLVALYSCLFRIRHHTVLIMQQHHQPVIPPPPFAATAGGLTDALQAFVLPPLIYVQMASSNSNAHALTSINTPINGSGQQTGSSGGGLLQGSSGPKLTSKRRLVCAAITAWGLATMVYTTWKIIQQGWNFESS